MGFAGREQVNKAAAHREFARVGHRIAAHIAIGLKQRCKLVAVNPCAGLQMRG